LSLGEREPRSTHPQVSSLELFRAKVRVSVTVRPRVGGRFRVKARVYLGDESTVDNNNNNNHYLTSIVPGQPG